MTAMLARLREKNLHTWLGGYLSHRIERFQTRQETGLRHLLFAFCDHYEPLWHGAPLDVGEARMRVWAEAYPRLVDRFRDADGLTPRHSFFFPGDQYHPRLLDRLTALTCAGHGEVELHLHHEGDSRASLREKLLESLERIGSHGHFARDAGGRMRYAFIHGNWALANGRPDGRCCGVDDELVVLFETGCYADFTFPSAPDESQPNIVNRIYWPEGDLRRARCYERGRRARVGERCHDRILIIQGPLALVPRLAWIPLRIENSAVHASPVGSRRTFTWRGARIGSS